jgi:hypothetical protein
VAREEVVYKTNIYVEKNKVEKVKLFFCLIDLALCHEDVWGSRGIAAPLLTSALDGG